MIPDTPLPFVDWSDPKEHVPAEWQWRFRALKPRPEPETPVYWPAPVVDASCILCPVCMNVCPTEAIKREILPTGEFELFLNLAACTGCSACVNSCPPDAMALESTRPYAAFSDPILLFSSEQKLEAEALEDGALEGFGPGALEET